MIIDSDWSSKWANHFQSPHFILNVWPRIQEKIRHERPETDELFRWRTRQLSLSWLIQNQMTSSIIEKQADEICSISSNQYKSKKSRTVTPELALPSLGPCSISAIERLQEECRKNEIEESMALNRLLTTKYEIAMQLVEQLSIIADIVKIIIDESFDQVCSISSYYRLFVENLHLKLNLVKSDLLISIFDNNVIETIHSLVLLLSQNVSEVKTELRKLHRSQEAFKNLGASGFDLATRYQRINDQIDLVTDDLNRLRKHNFI